MAVIIFHGMMPIRTANRLGLEVFCQEVLQNKNF